MVRPGRGGDSRLLFFVLLAVVVYALMSAAIAVATADECGELQADKTWEWVPPGWSCNGQ